MRHLALILFTGGYAFAQLSPITATVVSTEERFLPDGTPKAITTTQQYYRDAAGRTRTDSDGRAEIVDPVKGTTITLDLKSQIATVSAQTAGAATTAPATQPTATTATTVAARRVATIQKPTQKLGSQTIDGVTASGFRSELIMPPGSGGNIQPKRIINELWRSDTLHIPVRISTTESDILASGDRMTRRLTRAYQNISTPATLDPSLFAVPSGFQLVNSGKGN